MRVLLFANYRDSWPYIPELVTELRKREVEVDILDWKEMCIMQDGPGEVFPKSNALLKAATRVPKVRSIAAHIIMRKMIASLKPYDVINIHWLSVSYARLMRALKSRCKAIALTVWGSDFLRAGKALRESYKPILANVDLVMLGSREAKAEFEATYGRSRYRAEVIPFGHASFDIIDRLRSSETAEESRRILGLPSNRIIVALGYNGARAQQHEAMLEAVARLPDPVKAKTFFVLPMTYPKSPEYVERVGAVAGGTGVSYLVLNGFMSVEDVCRLRILCDITVNIQTTDMFSASIQEHCYCGSTMIVGRWLPYGKLEEAGFHLTKVAGSSEITRALAEAVAAGRGTEDAGARKRLYALSGWPAAASLWMHAFQTIAAGRNNG